MSEVDLITFLALIAGITLVLLVLLVAIYVYLSLTTMRLAKKTQTKHSWLAWIPIANFYLYSRMAQMHWWPVLLLIGLFIPYLELPSLITFAVFNMIWFWRTFEKVNRPGWWILLSLVPFFGWLIFLTLMGIAAWSDEKKETFVQAPPARVPQRQTKVSSVRLDRIKKLKGSLG